MTVESGGAITYSIAITESGDGMINLYRAPSSTSYGTICETDQPQSTILAECVYSTKEIQKSECFILIKKIGF